MKVTEMEWLEKAGNFQQRIKANPYAANLKWYYDISTQVHVGATVLDVGCGNRHLEKVLNNVVYRGIDPFPRDEFTDRITAEELVEHDGRYDTIFMMAALDNVMDLTLALEGLKHVAKKNIVIVTGIDIEPDSLHTIKVTREALVSVLGAPVLEKMLVKNVYLFEFMTEEIRGAEYYDEIYKESEEYKKPYTQSLYYELWMSAMNRFKVTDRILDIGCGPGQFAEMLYRNGIRNYTGIDFSSVAIKQARERIKEFRFIEGDARTESFADEYDLFIALEVFEHTDDFAVIKNIGGGKDILFAVPSFDYPSHVRYFKDLNEVFRRYDSVIQFCHAQKIDKWYLCRGTTI